jgi:hypothetical protein
VRLAVLALAMTALLVALAGSALAAFDPVPGNPADRLTRLPIDDEAYDHASRCRRSPMPGTRALETWLSSHAGGQSWGINRCEKLSEDNYSLHAEGRALDWHLDSADRAQRKEADRIVALLLAPDRLGNERALARRMGLQEIIWNCRAWFAGSDRFRPYSVCYDEDGERKRNVNRTLAHRDHIHLGLSRAGARMLTSFWTRQAPRRARDTAAARSTRARAAAR